MAKKCFILIMVVIMSLLILDKLASKYVRAVQSPPIQQEIPKGVCIPGGVCT